MQITKMEVANFRNIEQASHDLTQRCAFVGKNFTGKTNSTLAIHWALTDYLLDGSQDIPSIKPTSDPKKEVSVELTFDNGTTIKKTYKENLVKTRGTDTVTWQGHETMYYINGTKQSTIAAAQKMIKELLGLDIYRPSTNKIDLTRILLNPLHLPTQVEWKVFRTFMIELVGDVKDEDVFRLYVKFEKIRPILQRNQFKTDLALKYCKQQVSTAKDEIYKAEAVIAELSKVIDVNQEELAYALSKLDEIARDIAELELSRVSKKNPRIAELNALLNQTTEDKNKSLEADKKAYEESNRLFQDKIQENNKQINVYYLEVNSINESRNKLTIKLNTLTNQFTINQNNISNNNIRLADLRKRYNEIASQEFHQPKLPDSFLCPSCHYDLNGEVIEEAKKKVEVDLANWNKSIDDQLASIQKEAEKIKLESENIEFKNVDLNTEITALKTQLNGLSTESIQTKINTLQSENKNLQAQIIPFAYSELTNELNARLVELRNELSVEQTKNFNSDIDFKIGELKAIRNTYENVKIEHQAYLNTQKMIADKKVVIANYQKELTNHETQAILLEEFIKAKLEMLDENVQKVFGNIRFRLVESNIKEGSYNEVCYPLIIGTDTPFIHGSTSEKVITGVAIIEAIRKHLNLPNIPIIFDEAGTLDSETLVSRLNTNAQIISTKVNDNYDKPVVMSI